MEENRVGAVTCSQVNVIAGADLERLLSNQRFTLLWPCVGCAEVISTSSAGVNELLIIFN